MTNKSERPAGYGYDYDYSDSDSDSDSDLEIDERAKMRLVVIDFETLGTRYPVEPRDGVSMPFDPPIQVAALAIELTRHAGYREVEELCLQLAFDPDLVTDRQKLALELNSYSAERWADSILPGNAAPILEAFFGRHATGGFRGSKPPHRPYSAAVLVAHKADFDVAYLRWLFRWRKWTGATSWAGGAICTLQLAKLYSMVANVEFPSLRLSVLHRELFGEEYDSSHDALADVKATAKILSHILTRVDTTRPF